MSYFAVIRDAGPAWTDGKGALRTVTSLLPD